MLDASIPGCCPLPRIEHFRPRNMRKVISIYRHCRCILKKVRRRQDWVWHWEHILREFGTGPYGKF